MIHQISMLSLCMDFVSNSLHCHVNSPFASPLFLHQSPYHLRNRKHHGICGYVAPILDQKGVRTRGVSYLIYHTWILWARVSFAWTFLGKSPGYFYAFTPTCLLSETKNPWTPRKGETLKYENRSFPEFGRLEFIGSHFFCAWTDDFFVAVFVVWKEWRSKSKTMPIEAWWSFSF